MGAASTERAPGRVPLLQRRLLERLARGEWVFDELGPAFVAALRARVGDAGLGLDEDPLALTLLAYGVCHAIPSYLRAAPPDGLLVDTASAHEAAFWSHVAAAKLERRVAYARPSRRERRTVAEALAYLERWAPGTAAVLREWAPRLVPLAGEAFGGASHPHLFGCIFFDRDHLHASPAAMAVHLVHELGHQELFLLNAIDRLVEAGADAVLRHAPFQGVERPLIGRLHAGHALFRMIQLQHAAGLPIDDHDRLQTATIAGFEPGELTPFGRALAHDVHGAAWAAPRPRA